MQDVTSYSRAMQKDPSFESKEFKTGKKEKYKM
jgi:hypothetical protein